jgi:hypothetical protein
MHIYYITKTYKGAEPPFLYTLLLNLSSNWLYMAISSELVKVTLKKFNEWDKYFFHDITPF